MTTFTAVYYVLGEPTYVDFSNNPFDQSPLAADYACAMPGSSEHAYVVRLHNVSAHARDPRATNGTCMRPGDPPQYLNTALNPPLCLPVGIEVDHEATVMEPHGRYFCHRFRVSRGYCGSNNAPLGTAKGIAPASVFDFDWESYFSYQNCRCVPGLFGERGQCRPCPEQAFCPGGDTQTLVIPMASFWRRSWRLGSTDPILRCRQINARDVCSPNFDSRGVWLHPTRPCAQGFTDRLCSRCDSGYFAWGQRCYQCGETWYWQLLSFATGFIALVAVFAYAYGHSQESQQEGDLKVLIFFFQGAQLLPILGVRGLASQISGSLFLNIEFSGPECFMPFDFVSRFWLMMLLPPFALALVFIVFLVGRCIRLARFSISDLESSVSVSLHPFDKLDKRQTDFKEALLDNSVSVNARDIDHTEARLSWADRNIRTALFMLLFLYVPVAQSVLTMLPVDEYHYLLHAPYLSASDSRVSLAHWCAWAFVVVYVLGFPAFMASRIVSNQRARAAVMDASAHFFVDSYRDDCYYFEAVILLRRLAMSAVIAGLDPSSVYLPLGIFTIYLSSYIAQRHMLPFRRPIDNQLELVSLGTLTAAFPFICTVWAGYATETVGIGVVVLHAAVAIGIVACVIADAVKNLKSKSVVIVV